MLCDGGIVYSDSFVLNGVEWRLKIYPRGNGVAKGKYLSVFVEMSKAERSQKKY
jgi:tripartite motif-containing protein 37